MAGFIIAGCGGGGQAVTPSISTELKTVDLSIDSSEDVIALDYDISNGGGRTAAQLHVESEMIASAIIEIGKLIAGLPDSAFVSESKQDVKLAGSRSKRLKKILLKIKDDVSKDKYRQAQNRIEKKLLPRLDGCNGGKEEDDYIAACEVKNILYEKSSGMLAVLIAWSESQPCGGKQSGKCRSDTSGISAAMLSAVDDLLAQLSGLSVYDYTGVGSNQRDALLGIVIIAVNYMIDGDFVEAKNELEQNLLPYVDGAYGGNSSDDLIFDPQARDEVCLRTLDVINRISAMTVMP